MSTPDSRERDYDLSGYPSKDQDFLKTVQDRLDERPLAHKTRGGILDLFGHSKAPHILLAFSGVTFALSLILGSKEIFAGGVCLSFLWQARTGYLSGNPF